MRSISHILTFGAVAAISVALAACGPKKGQDSDRAKPAGNVDESVVGGPAPVPGQLTVMGVQISEKETSTIVRISTSEVPSDNYTVFKLTDPMRVVVDVQNSAMGEVGGPYQVGNGTVNEVSASFFEDEGNKVTRVMIGLDKLVEYTVQVDGSAIVIEIPREGPMPAVAEMGTNVGGGGVAMSEAVAPTETAMTETAMTETPLMEEAPVTETPVTEEQPLFTESAPAEIPAESVPVEAAPVEEQPLFTEATPEPAPESTPMEMAATEPAFESAPVVESTPEPVVEATPEPLFTESQPIESAPMESAPMESAPMDSAPVESAPVESAPMESSSSFASESSSSSSSRRGGGLVKMTALDWNDKNASASRIIIKTAEPVSYEELTPESNQVVLELKGVRVPKSLERALDTSEFKSAVKLVSTYQAGDNARVVVQLRENVGHRVEQNGSTYYFDFDRPAGLSGSDTVASAATSDPAPMESAPAEAAPMEMMAEAPMETMESTPAPMVAAAQPVAASQNGRPAETLFLDPTYAPAGGRPLAATGASALAGLQGASEIETGVAKVYTGRRLNMDFKDADIHNVLRIIANVSKLNIITSDAVQGKVTVRLINVPWDQALDIILQSKKLGMERQGNIIRVDTLANFAAERDEKLKAKESLSKLIPIHTYLLPVSYATAAEMKQRLDPFLSKEGKITIDDRTNTLLIQDHAEQLNRIRELSRALDTQTPQVLIEARLVEARTTFARTIGIQWGGAFNPNPTGLFFPNIFGTRGGNGPLNVGPRGTPEDNLAINLPGPSVSSIALFTGSIGNVLDLDARLGALETTDEIKVVSSPRIATLDNRTARISQGARIPYLSTSQQGTQTQFIDATLEINVTPHITADKSVFMAVQVRNNRPGAATLLGQPSIDIAEANTEILVKDGDTSVIGGVYVVNRTFSEQGMPGLRKIPFLGFLFRARQTNEDRRELLVFLTPRIITRSQQQARN